MSRLSKTLNVNDKASWLRGPVEYGPVGTTLGQRKPRFRDRRTREAKALRDKRQELTAACGGPPTAVQATLIEHICQQYADLQMYGFRKATSEEPVSEHQDQLAVALYNTHERYLKAFRDTLPPPAPATEEADKLVALIRGMSSESLAAMVKALEELDGDEVQARLANEPMLMVLPDNGRGDGPPISPAAAKIAKKLEAVRDRLEAGGAVPLTELPPAPAGDSQSRAESEPTPAPRESVPANPRAQEWQRAAKNAEQERPKLPPNITVDEIKPQPRAGTTVWTGR